MHFLDLPLDVLWNHVVIFLQDHDSLSLLSSCRHLHALVTPSIDEVRAQYLTTDVSELHSPVDIDRHFPLTPVIQPSDSEEVSGHSFEARLIKSTSPPKTITVSSLFLSLLFDHNRRRASTGKSIHFAVAGGSVLNGLLNFDHEQTLACRMEPEAVMPSDLERFTSPSPSTSSSNSIIPTRQQPGPDVDVFIIVPSDSTEEAEEAQSELRELLHTFHEHTVQHHVTYVVSRSDMVMNLVPESNDDTVVQLILSPTGSIHQLLLFFDLDCSRFAFDGLTVYSNSLAVRSLASRVNLVPSHYFHSAVHVHRVNKYRKRGFVSVVHDSVLSHLLTVTMVCELSNTKRALNGERQHSPFITGYTPLLGEHFLGYEKLLAQYDNILQLVKMYGSGESPGWAKLVAYHLALSIPLLLQSMSEPLSLNTSPRELVKQHSALNHGLRQCGACGAYSHKKMHMRKWMEYLCDKCHCALGEQATEPSDDAPF